MAMKGSNASTTNSVSTAMRNPKIAVITDSSSDLPPDVAATYGIRVVPLGIQFGSESFLDGVDLSKQEFWSKVRSFEDLPTTSAPSPVAFGTAIDEAVAGGADGVVVVTLPAALSATHQAAVTAASERPQVPIELVDSGTVSMALGLRAIHAAQVASAGGTLADVTTAASAESHVVAVFETLEFLKRGGRIGRAQALLGSALRIRPVIEVLHGEVVPLGRVRTLRAALDDLVRRLDAVADRLADVAIVHGDNPGAAEELATRVRQRFSEIDPTMALVGPVIGTHSGPGTIGVAYRLK